MAHSMLPKLAIFLSTPSARRATLKKRGESNNIGRFLSTPSARRATRQAFQVQKYYEISIHALREEGDVQHSRPCRSSLRFLSTPSARRATVKMVM